MQKADKTTGSARHLIRRSVFLFQRREIFPVVTISISESTPNVNETGQDSALCPRKVTA